MVFVKATTGCSLPMSLFLYVWILWSAVDAQPYNMECDFGSHALSTHFGVDIPQTCLQTDGHRRCFYTFVPECAVGEVPLVYDIHGSKDCPVNFAEKSGWFKKAKEECFVVVWPTGNNQASLTDDTCWDVPGGNALDPAPENEETLPCCCNRNSRDLQPDATHDAEFLRRLAKLVVDRVPEMTNNQTSIDTKRIYMSGHSNGCTMSLAMAAMHSDLVAAVCCMAGSFITPPSMDYIPTPIWNIVGEEDDLMPYEGFFQPNYGLVFPDAQASFQSMADSNGCSDVQRSEEEISDMTIMGKKGVIHTDRALKCFEDATVEFVTISTAGHNLYPTMEEHHPFFAARTTVDTTSMAWDFCKSHSLSEQPVLTMAPTASPTSPVPTEISSAFSTTPSLLAILVVLVANMQL